MSSVLRCPQMFWDKVREGRVALSLNHVFTDEIIVHLWLTDGCWPQDVTYDVLNITSLLTNWRDRQRCIKHALVKCLLYPLKYDANTSTRTQCRCKSWLRFSISRESGRFLIENSNTRIFCPFWDLFNKTAKRRLMIIETWQLCNVRNSLCSVIYQ